MSYNTEFNGADGSNAAGADNNNKRKAVIPAAGYNGILIMDKPEGFTSFDLCAKLRGMLATRRIGHSGTLDPMATGVMVVLLGAATRASDILPDQDKRYSAGFRLGVTTDTLDITGVVTREMDFCVGRSQLESALMPFRGEIFQLPPMYSAVQVGGRRLYDLARKGLEVERSPRKAVIYQLTLMEYDEMSGEGVLDVTCSKGTYIRTLVDDLGRALGCGAVLTSLRRTMASGFTEDDAITLERAQTLRDGGLIDSRILTVDVVFRSYPSCKISDRQSARYFNGGELSLDRVTIEGVPEGSGLVRVYSGEGFIGLARVDVGESLLRPFKRFI